MLRVVCRRGFRARLFALGALAPAAAGSGLPVRVDYQGVYEYHESAQQAGMSWSTVDQTFSWAWSASGELPLATFSTALLPGRLTVAGEEKTTSAAGPPTDCKYSAPPSSLPMRLTQSELAVGYGLGIPGADAACGGGAPAGPSDVLACDLNTCDAGICPAGPPAVSTERFQTPVLTAFKPTTSYLNTGYRALYDSAGTLWGTVTDSFDLPPASGMLTTNCLQGITETVQMSIISDVTISVNDGANGPFSVNFPDGQFPDISPPIPLLPVQPLALGIPTISVPPVVPQPPDVTTAPPPGPDPVTGVIEIRCPRRDRRCRGAVTVTGTTGGPRGVLGRVAYSAAGGQDTLLGVRLDAAAGAMLRQAGQLSVRVSVSSVVLPGSRRSSGHRTVLLTAFTPIPGVPSS